MKTNQERIEDIENEMGETWKLMERIIKMQERIIEREDAILESTKIIAKLVKDKSTKIIL